MKEILIRLFAHEELSHEEACNLMKGITRGDYNEAQIASLLTVFQMRGIKVNELTGFREALLTTRVPVDFSDFQPIDIVGTGGDGKNTFNISTCACFIVAGRICRSQTRKLRRNLSKWSEQRNGTARGEIYQR